MKLFLCCKKDKTELYLTDKGYVLTDFGLGTYFEVKHLLNGRVFAECECDIEDIKLVPDNYFRDAFVITAVIEKVLKNGCLTRKELLDYLQGKNGYAIHTKNLKSFDKPKEISSFSKIIETPYGEEPDSDLKKAPANITRCCYLENGIWKSGYMISVSPKEAYGILNENQDIIIRKKIAKDMKEELK